jgi:hypothetical protein
MLLVLLLLWPISLPATTAPATTGGAHLVSIFHCCV